MLSPRWVTSFLLVEEQKKSGGTHQNQGSKDLKLTFGQSDDAEINIGLHVNHFNTATLFLISHLLIKAGMSKSIAAKIAFLSIQDLQKPQV